jgi:hypothetical protein
MLEHGEWRPADRRWPHRRIPSLSLQPGRLVQLGDAAEMYEQAQKTPDLMKGFVNTVLGLPFEEAEAPGGNGSTSARGLPHRRGARAWPFLTAASMSKRPDRGRGGRLGPGQGELVGRLPGDRGRHRPARVWQSWTRCSRETGRSRATPADPGDVRRRRLRDPGRLRLGAAAPAGELGAGGAARGSRGRSGGQGRDRDTALLLSVSGPTPAASGAGSGLVGRHAGRKGELYRWLKLEWPTEEAWMPGQAIRRAPATSRSTARSISGS